MANETYQARRGAQIAGFTAVNDWGDAPAQSSRAGASDKKETPGHRLPGNIQKQVRSRSQKIVRFIAENWGLDHAYVVDHFCLDGEVDASVCAGFFLSTLLAPQESSNIAGLISEGEMSIDDLGCMVAGDDEESDDSVSDEMQSFFVEYEELLTKISEVICAFVDTGTYVDPQGVYTAVTALIEQQSSDVS